MFIFTGAAGLVASCLGACAMTACCTGTKELMRRSARLAYCLLFVLAMVTAWILRDFAQPLLEKIPWIVRPDVSDAWYGKQAVYRISLGNFSFFGILALALLGVKYRSDKRDVYLHHGGWIIKLVLWLLFNALPFLAPVPLVSGYAWLARVGGGAFLVLQMLILLDFTQTLNDSWVEADDERYLYILLAATLGCYAGIVGTAAFLLYVFKTAGSSCSLNVFLIVSSLLLVIAFSVVSLHPAAKNGSLFPSAVIGMYCMYLTYSALASEPHNYECNGLYNGDKGISAGNESTLVLSMLGTLGAVVWSALRAGSNTALFSTSSPTAAALVEQPLIETGSDSGDRSAAGDEEEAGGKAMDEFEPVSYNYSFFHFIFSLASMYLGMLLTGWGVGVEEQDVIDVGWASVWVKVGALWLIGLMYVWTLLAPAVFPDREF
jgi:hypothetical protein|mmetsp:Transcript_9089/g.16386  ORF Transcript_9089/g.16386 Transcript_9089/m.16386 type:complete len:433 (-) Transcript_9089:288-1586(-)